MAKPAATAVCQITWIVCGWLMSPHRTLCTVQVICANWIICCTAGVSGNIFICWDAPDNLVCSRQNFFLFFYPEKCFWMVACCSKYSLLCTLSVVLKVFICSILETGSLADVRYKEWKIPFSPCRIFHFLNQTISKMLCLKNVKMISSVQNNSRLFLFDNW